MHGLSIFPSLLDHPPPPLESFLLQAHIDVRQAGAVWVPDPSPGEAGVTPKAVDHMWTGPAADRHILLNLCLICA